jgi:kynureninase
MKNEFIPIPTAEAWQISNGSVLAMAPLVGSLALFDEAGGLGPIRGKSKQMSLYMDYLLDSQLAGKVESITPRDLDQRGCQLSLKVVTAGVDGQAVFGQLQDADVECDWRFPNVIRVAPAPLFNSFEDIHRFVEILSEALG